METSIAEILKDNLLRKRIEIQESGISGVVIGFSVICESSYSPTQYEITLDDGLQITLDESDKFTISNINIL